MDKLNLTNNELVAPIEKLMEVEAKINEVTHNILLPPEQRATIKKVSEYFNPYVLPNSETDMTYTGELYKAIQKINELIESVNGGATTTDILDGSVTTPKLANLAVTTEKIAGSAITTAKLYPLSVTTDKIAQASINASKLTEEILKRLTPTVSTSDYGKFMMSNEVSGTLQFEPIRQLGTASVTEDDIATAAVTTSKLATNSISAEKVQAGAIGNEKISSEFTVSGAMLGQGIVGNVNLTNDVKAQLVPSYGSATGGEVLTVKVLEGVTSIDFEAPSGGEIPDGSVTASKLSENSVTTSKIVDGAVLGIKIGDGEVAGNNIKDLSISTAKINDKAVTMEKVADSISGNLVPQVTSVDYNKVLGTDSVGTKVWVSGGGGGLPPDDSITNAMLKNDIVTINKMASAMIPRLVPTSGLGSVNDVLTIDTDSAIRWKAPSGGGLPPADSITTEMMKYGCVIKDKLSTDVQLNLVPDVTVSDFNKVLGTSDVGAVGWVDGGGGGLPPADSITSAMIKQKAVITEKINDFAITEQKITQDAVTAVKIKAGAVTKVKLGTDVITVPSFTPAENNKVLGVKNGALAWVEQSGGGGFSVGIGVPNLDSVKCTIDEVGKVASITGTSGVGNLYLLSGDPKFAACTTLIVNHPCMCKPEQYVKTFDKVRALILNENIELGGDSDAYFYFNNITALSVGANVSSIMAGMFSTKVGTNMTFNMNHAITVNQVALQRATYSTCIINHPSVNIIANGAVTNPLGNMDTLVVLTNFNTTSSDYSSIGKPKNVYIGDLVSTMPSGFQYNNSNLTSINLNKVSLIEPNAFNSMTNLTVTIPNNVCMIHESKQACRCKRMIFPASVAPPRTGYLTPLEYCVKYSTPYDIITPS